MNATGIKRNLGVLDPEADHPGVRGRTLLAAVVVAPFIVSCGTPADGSSNGPDRAPEQPNEETASSSTDVLAAGTDVGALDPADVFAADDGDVTISEESRFGTLKAALNYEGACIDSDWIDRLAYGGRERRERGPFYSDFGWCHTQGAGYRYNDRRIVVTCQDDDDIARTVVYKSGTSSMKDHSYIRTKTPVTEYTETYLQHPSSTQIVDDYFPVAFANHVDTTGIYGSKLTMYEVTSSGSLDFVGYSLNVMNTGTSQDDPHIGTIGMRSSGSSYVLFTCDYNCRNIYKFKWSPSTGIWSSLGAIGRNQADDSDWEDAVSWDSYNSLNFAKACSGSKIYLVGTKRNGSTHKIHLWRILSGGDTEDASELSLKNVAWRHFESDNWYFREGAALIPNPPYAHFLTFGADFDLLDGDLYGDEFWFYDEEVDDRFPPTGF